MQTTVALIVPCYNEEARLRGADFLRLARSDSGLRLLFVDDGSTDRTQEVLGALRREGEGRIEVLALPRNGGKAEAVRRGMLEALAQGAQVVGFVDADLSTPVEEIGRLVRSLDGFDGQVALGARVRLLGTRIDRSPLRHYLGRVFATLASLALRLPVYDTQCGAKVFRAGPALGAALARPFRSRWIFDVELIDRLLRGANGVQPLAPEAFTEVPLRTWSDVSGSKLRLLGMLRAGGQLLSFFVRTRIVRRKPPAAAVPQAPAPPAAGEARPPPERPPRVTAR